MVTSLAFNPDPTTSGAELGRHRHRGTVDGVVLSGSWAYREYGWRVTVVGLVSESPGVIHAVFFDEGIPRTGGKGNRRGRLEVLECRRSLGEDVIG